MNNVTNAIKFVTGDRKQLTSPESTNIRWPTCSRSWPSFSLLNIRVLSTPKCQINFRAIIASIAHTGIFPNYRRKYWWCFIIFKADPYAQNNCHTDHLEQTTFYTPDRCNCLIPLQTCSTDATEFWSNRLQRDRIPDATRHLFCLATWFITLAMVTVSKAPNALTKAS